MFKTRQKSPIDREIVLHLGLPKTKQMLRNLVCTGALKVAKRKINFVARNKTFRHCHLTRLLIATFVMTQQCFTHSVKTRISGAPQGGPNGMPMIEFGVWPKILRGSRLILRAMSLRASLWAVYLPVRPPNFLCGISQVYRWNRHA